MYLPLVGGGPLLTPEREGLGRGFWIATTYVSRPPAASRPRAGVSRVSPADAARGLALRQKINGWEGGNLRLCRFIPQLPQSASVTDVAIQLSLGPADPENKRNADFVCVCRSASEGSPTA